MRLTYWVIKLLILCDGSQLSSAHSEAVLRIPRRYHTPQPAVALVTARKQHEEVLVLVQILVHIHGQLAVDAAHVAPGVGVHSGTRLVG